MVRAPAVRGAVVDDPEHAPGVPVGGGGHDLLDEATEGRDARVGLTASDNVGPVHVEGRQVGSGAAPLVFVFDAHGATGAGRRGGVGTVTRLDTRLLVRRNDELVVVEGLALPASLIQIEDGCGFLSELGVAGEEPGAMLPGTNRVLGEPAPNHAATDGTNQAGFLRVSRDLRPAPPREGHAVR